ncbi:MAG: hypothetical protein MUO63_05810 [Desulfobulbaceae bacterium]|nr:hypothetical protein [Desulfobulbaceae bacterium]
MIEQKKILRQTKAKKPALLSIAGVDFLLQPRGTPSGYPLLLENEGFKIERGEFNKQNVASLLP